MAVFVVRDAKFYYGSYDITTDLKSVVISPTQDIRDSTTLGSAERTKAVGLKHCTFSGEGFAQTNTAAFEVEDVINAYYGTDNVLTSVFPYDEAAGNNGYVFYTDMAEFSLGGSIGEMYGFTIRGEGSGKLIHSTVEKTGNITATGNSTGTQLGALAAGQTLYAAMHVVTVSGTNPTLDVTIESDDNADFTSATTRATFTQATDETNEMETVSGAVTDDYWRMAYTVGGTDTPTFNVMLSMGIL